MTVFALPANQPETFHRGAGRIAAFRSAPGPVLPAGRAAAQGALPDAVVHLGFARDVGAGELAAWVREQRIGELPAATNRIPVRAGETLPIPYAAGPLTLTGDVQALRPGPSTAYADRG